VPQAWAAGLALVVGLAGGVAGGWGGHAWWVAHGPAAVHAGAAQVPAFVRDAAIAHVVYQPEKRHPVEVGADQQDHLVQWLSKRLGQPLKLPSLDDQGFHLVGGRLLPSGESKGVLARAQFMYEDAQGRRLTLYVSTGAASAEVPVGFRMTQQTENGQVTRSLYWIDGRLGYALNGAFDEARLRELAQRVHEQLG
jgi:anti-sigma factor RsiW